MIISNSKDAILLNNYLKLGHTRNCKNDFNQFLIMFLNYIDSVYSYIKINIMDLD